MKITTTYMLEEYHKFRGIMCSSKHDRQQKLKAWEGLLFTYVHMEVDKSEKDKEQAETVAAALQSLMVELPMRLGLEASAVMEAIVIAENDRE
jgi:hypothetical protein